ncbi:MAG: dethiobiotin synthase [Planctomycetes bacterium]|nr:dethiobiotin synthase [Planctomycetota bacterium]
MTDSSKQPSAYAGFGVAGYPTLPAVRGVFVTGTDTEVGKTLLAGAIARHLRQAGKRVGVFKPAATGCQMGPDGELVSEDARFLADCAGRPHPLTVVAPQRFAEPLAPNVAAERAGRQVDLDAIFRAYRQIAADSDFVVVEGVGGLLCPISDGFWVIHMAMLCRLPMVIVARANLGTINHTLLTLHAARSARLTVAGVVINRYPVGTTDAAVATNARQIADRGKVIVLTRIDEDPGCSVPLVRLGAKVRQAIDQVDWLSICER